MILSSSPRLYLLSFVALCLILLTLSTRLFRSVVHQYVLASYSQPANTIVASPPSSPLPPWLMITSSASSDFQRRLLIRWTWVSLFRPSGIFDHIFAVSSTDPVLLPLLRKENETFGDILLLDSLEDTEWTANQIKPFEFFKKVTDEGWKGRRTYDFVSKVDQDTFPDPVRVWEKYLKARMRSSGIAKDRLMLSMPHEEFCECPSPQGGFYTLSWDLAKVIARLYDGMEDVENIGQEDCMVGRFPTDAGEEFEFISMDGTEAFDVIGEEGDPIARDWSKDRVGVEKGSLKELKNVAFLHQMKEEWKWLAVKDLFDKNGWVPNRISGGSRNTNEPLYTNRE